MLSPSDKYVLTRVLYDSLSNLLKLNRITNGLEIENVKYNNIILSEIVFRNIFVLSVDFLNNTKSNNIKDALEEWNNGLEDRVLLVYKSSINQLENESFIESQKHILELEKQFYMFLSPLVNNELYKNNLFLQNINLSRSIKFFVMHKYIKNYIVNHPNLSVIELTKLYFFDNKTTTAEVVSETLNVLTTPVFPVSLDEYL